MGGNGIGVVGANPDAYIMPVTVMQSNGSGDIATIVKGIDYAYANGADVISMSIGGFEYSIAEEQALSKAYSKCFLVAAAGNNGLCITETHPHFPTPKPMYPAAYTFVLGVQAACDASGSLATFSNYDDDGPIYTEYNEKRLYNYEVIAPGCNILSTYPDGRYISMNGTSMACPLVAGIASRIMQKKEILSNETLFGDFIYSSCNMKDGYPISKMLDAKAAFELGETDRKPNLHLLNVEYVDSLGDKDGRLDAGEIVDVYPTFQNDWGETYGGVTVSLEIADNEDPTICEFITNDVPLGCDMSAYGKVKCQTPIRIKLRDDIVDGRVVKLVARAKCFNMSDDYQPATFTFKVENGIELGGTQREDITLYPGIQYIVTRNWGIPKDRVVTIKAGTTIKIKDNVGISNYGYMLFEGTRDSMITITKGDLDLGNIGGFLNDNDNYSEFNYVIFDNLNNITFNGHRYNNCIIRNCVSGLSIMTQNATFKGCDIYNNYVCEPYFVDPCTCHAAGKIGWFTYGSTFIETSIHGNIFNHGFGSAARFYHSNYIDNETLYTDDSPDVRTLESSNCFGNFYDFKAFTYNSSYKPGYYSVIFNTTEPEIFYLSDAYLGTASDSIAYNSILDSEDNIGWGTVDVWNKLEYADETAPACVDYIKVDGLNPLDDGDKMSPLGVGTHTIEVGFNRVMDQTITPSVSMGVRLPYTQKQFADNGRWFDPYTYKASITINGKSSTDGTNRIRISGYQQKDQNPEFVTPNEMARYNVLVSAAGSMSTGLMAVPGLGTDTLSWTTDDKDFDDLLGYNLYRFTMDENGVSSDTIMVNTKIIESTEKSYVDYNVVPGTTYYYYIKEIGTSLTENSISDVVAVTPLTAQKGDANGSLTVDIADVMTEIAYLSDEDPQPFIFDAADVNSDSAVNILDVVATLNIITKPDAGTEGEVEKAVAYYEIRDGKLYLDSPVTIGGIQVRLNSENGEPVTADDELVGMENLTAKISNNTSIFLSYSMSGKIVSPGEHSLLSLSEGTSIEEMVLSSPRGVNIAALPKGSTIISTISIAKNATNGIYDLTGRRLTSLPKHGVVIVNGKKICL